MWKIYIKFSSEIILNFLFQTELPTKEEPKEVEFQLPSVKNLRSHFEGANSNNFAGKKEPAYIPKKFTAPKFTVLNTVNLKHNNNNNNHVSLPVPVATKEPVVVEKPEPRVLKPAEPKVTKPEPRIEKPKPVVEKVKIASPPKEEIRLPEVEEVKVMPQVSRQVSFSERNDSFSAPDSRSETSNTTNNSNVNTEDEDEEEYVEPIMKQFSEEYEEEVILKPRPTTRSWDPVSCIFFQFLYFFQDQIYVT